MRAKSIVLLLLALGCGLVASIGITQVINRAPKEVTIREGMTPILVAMVDIPMGEPIDSVHVKLEPWPQANVPLGALTKLSDIEDRRSRTEIIAGEPILDRKLLAKGVTSSSAAEFIPMGYRVLAVKVDKSDGAGLIMPGDRVDVLLHIKSNKSRGISEDRTLTILQDIKVFAVGDIFKLGGPDKNDISITAKTISLLVDPRQAQKLDLGTQLGKVRLVMRGLKDEKVVAAGSISVGDLLGITDGSDREAEEKTTPARKKGLLGLLGMSQLPKLTQADEPRTWSVRKLQGNEVEDITLEEVKEGGVVHWRVESQKEKPGYAMATPDDLSTIMGDGNVSGANGGPIGEKPNKQEPGSD